MAHETKYMTVDEFKSNLDQVLDKVALDGDTVIVETEGDAAIEVRLAEETGSAARRPPGAAAYAAFRAAAGSWADVDTDKLLADIYESRRLPPRPPVEL